jgi:hypothetical protein
LQSILTTADVTISLSTQAQGISHETLLSTELTQTASLVPDFNIDNWNDTTQTFTTLQPTEATSKTAADVGTDMFWNPEDSGISTNATVVYTIVATMATVALMAAVITLIARRVSRLLDTGNGIYLPTNHVTGGASSYISVGGDSPTGRLDCFYAELSDSGSCWCCICRLCSFWRYHCLRATTDDRSSAAGNKYDYIYRPLGGLGSGNGSRIEDEYETTFVGVSIPLLHEVSDI